MSENTYVARNGRRACRLCQRLNRAAGLVRRGRYHPPNCPQGHEYSAENTYVARTGSRMCRTCSRLRMRMIRAARRATADGRYSDDPPRRDAA